MCINYLVVLGFDGHHEQFHLVECCFFGGARSMLEGKSNKFSFSVGSQGMNIGGQDPPTVQLPVLKLNSQKRQFPPFFFKYSNVQCVVMNNFLII